MRAASIIFSLDTPVILSTKSRLKFCSDVLKAAKFSQRFLIKDESINPSSTITRIIPISKATSVPGWCRKKIPANRHRSISLGLATISFAPFRTAFFICSPIIGWASVVLVPMAKIQAASLISLMELVIAPLPKLCAKPATVGAWHNLAQWSILFVPITTRVNFCII